MRLSCRLRGLWHVVYDHHFGGLPILWSETSRRKNRSVHAHRTVGITDFAINLLVKCLKPNSFRPHRMRLPAICDVTTANGMPISSTVEMRLPAICDVTTAGWGSGTSHHAMRLPAICDVTTARFRQPPAMRMMRLPAICDVTTA